MKIFKAAYIFPILFIAIGIYQMFRVDFLEASLYIIAGLAFVFNAMASEERLAKHKKTLVTITWTLLGISVLIFFWVLQFNTP
ncbi:hypothetical protein [Pseudochryseolinea flava]|uniref:DUF3953 domain-containing protein n=1 Tax=Pseudochryseolinea flava TaxID=2059302 RepID=A0A364YC44_9BACT|nr:hypothetical protein [Pseudochryseolinea flava]RAW03308.1 hypothetical protein DQQ10_04280 [Pseudochryseolinea flava]